MGRKRRGKRSKRKGGGMRYYNKVLHHLHHLDTWASRLWVSPERMDELLEEDREGQKVLELEAPPVRGERET